MKNKKRILSVLLSVLMLLSLNNASIHVYARDSISAAEVANYMNSLVGQTNNYRGYCLLFVTKCWEAMGFTGSYGWGTAANFANANRVSYSRDNIPIGADVFFSSDDGLGHIGIYVGDGYFVHAGNKSTYEKSNLSETYFSNHYTGWGWQPYVTVISDTAPPSYDDFHVGEIQSDQFTVMAHVTDPSGVKSVRYAVWTSNNGQDDLKWYDGFCTDGNGYYWSHIKYAEHNNEKGTYIIHMYMTDNVGNEKSVGINYVPAGSEMTSGCARVLDDGIYIIANAASPDLEKSIYYLDIEGVESPAKDGTNVSLCGPNNIKEFPFYDMWQITYSNGFYSIKQAGTNVSLDVGNASQETRANVISCGYHGGSNQQWAISKNGSGGYRVRAKCSGMSLDVAGGGTVNGTNIRQLVNNDSAAQSWIFIKHEHSFGAWEIDEPARCTLMTVKRRVCQYCGYSVLSLTSGTIHSYHTVVTPPTCTEQGYSTHTCVYCGDCYVEAYLPETGHTFADWETVTASTCVTDGSERRVCSVCGEVEERIIPAHHTEQLIRTVSPTCTNGGYDLVRCTVCGTRYQTNSTAALGHHHVLVETVNPTCTEKGYDVYCCDRCGDTYQTNETAALGHHHMLTETVAPTCAEVGYEVYCCDRCGDTYQTNETAALGHDYQFTGTVAATCVKAGYHRYTCTRCGGEERTAIPAIGHYFLDGFCVDCCVDERIAPFDINGDTTLDAVDLILTRMALLKKEEETPCDFNNDGVSDIRDMVRMKKMLATFLP